MTHDTNQTLEQTNNRYMLLRQRIHCFCEKCEESLNDRSFLVFEILKGGGTLCPTTIPPIAKQVQKAHGE